MLSSKNSALGFVELDNFLAKNAASNQICVLFADLFGECQSRRVECCRYYTNSNGVFESALDRLVFWRVLESRCVVLRKCCVALKILGNFENFSVVLRKFYVVLKF